jgi:hypothetical protein
MGYTCGEMSAQEAQNHDHRIDRIIALRKGLEHISSSEFTVGELPAVLRIMGRWQDPTEEDLNQIEPKLNDLMCGP